MTVDEEPDAPVCTAEHFDGWVCTLSPGHDGMHEAWGQNRPGPFARWDAPPLEVEVKHLRETVARVEALAVGDSGMVSVATLRRALAGPDV